MKKIFPILILFGLLGITSDLISQTRPRTTTSSRRQPVKKETVSLMDKLNYEIKLGNPGFSNNTFSLTTKFNAGYKFVKWASAGVGFRSGLLYLNNPAGIPDKTYLDYGAFVYGRGRITNSIYLQAEYGTQNVALLNGTRQKFWAPLVGGGYMQGSGNWSYGVELLYNINQVAQDFNGPLEYWLNFSYKF
jgi:hypothetical protein